MVQFRSAQDRELDVLRERVRRQDARVAELQAEITVLNQMLWTQQDLPQCRAMCCSAIQEGAPRLQHSIQIPTCKAGRPTRRDTHLKSVARSKSSGKSTGVLHATAQL